jgi:excisionase family DNA binding protein
LSGDAVSDFGEALTVLEQVARSGDPAAVPALVGELERVRAIAWARLTMPPPAAPPRAGVDLLTVPQAAAQLGVQPQYVYDLTRRGELVPVRFGKYVRIDPADLARWVARHKTLDDGLGQWQSLRRVGRRIQAAPDSARDDAGAGRAPARGHDVGGVSVGSGPARHS